MITDGNGCGSGDHSSLYPAHDPRDMPYPCRPTFEAEPRNRSISEL